MSALRIGVLLPEVLGTYADGGNALVLAERARRRGFDAQIQYVGVGDAIPDDLDIYTLVVVKTQPRNLRSRLSLPTPV